MATPKFPRLDELASGTFVSNEKSRDELASEVEMALIAVEKACDSMDEALA